MNERPSAFGALLRGLLDDLTQLLRAEIRLGRLEIEQKLQQVLSGLWLLGGGLVFAIVTVVLAALAAVAALAETLEPWQAHLVVAGGTLLLCLLFLTVARRSLAAGNLKPTRTIRTLSKDADAIQEAMNDVPR